MCDLITGMMVASTAVSAVGSVMSGNASAAASRADAATAEMNAKLLNYRIDDELRMAGDENRRLGENAAGVIGQQTVYGAAGNVDLTMGSPLRALLASAEAASRDAGTTMDNTMRTVRDLRMDQANLRNSAASLRTRAKNEKKAGRLNALGTIVGGAGNVMGSRAERGVARPVNIGRASFVI